jgi:ankyrin repeat protein
LQAREELDNLRSEWQKVAVSTLKFATGPITDDDVDTLMAFPSIPSDMIEEFLRRVDFTRVSPLLQQRVLAMLAGGSGRLNRVVVNGFTALDQRSVVALVPPGCCLRVLKLVNCGEFVMSSSSAVALAKCPTLRSLTIEGSPRLEQFATSDGVVFQSTRPVRFAELEVLRLRKCPMLQTVVASFSGPKECRVVIDDCPALANVTLSGAVDWAKCPPLAQCYMPDMKADVKRRLSAGAYSAIARTLRLTGARCDIDVGNGEECVVVAVGKGELMVTRASYDTAKSILLDAITVEGVTSISLSKDNMAVQPGVVDALLKWRAESPDERKLVFTSATRIDTSPGDVLWKAADGGFVEAVKEILHSHGEALSQTILHQAAASGQVNVVQTLVDSYVRGAPGTVNMQQDIGSCAGITPLYVAARNGHVGVVRVLVSAGANVDLARAGDGATPLYMAAQNGHDIVASVLLDKQADVNQATADGGITPLYAAAHYGHVDVVRVLVHADASVNQKTTDNGFTPLYTAARNGHVDVVRELIGAHANVDPITTDGGITPLWIAALKGHVDVVRVLVRTRADVNQAMTDDGTTPLYAAALKGHVDVVRELIGARANVDPVTTDGGITPLWIAALKGHVDVASILIDANADVDKATTDDGSTPLCVAAQNGHVNVVDLLIRTRANVDQGTTDNGFTPLYAAAQNGHVDVVDLLIGARANVDQGTIDDGSSPLYAAALKGHVDVVQVLIGARANVHKGTTDDGTSPLLVAAQNGHVDVVRELVDANANVDQATTDDATTPLYVAAHSGHVDVVCMLVAAHANVGLARTNDGTTSLWIAARKGHLDVVRVLVDAHADVDQANHNGATPLSAAVSSNHHDVVEFFRASVRRDAM